MKALRQEYLGKCIYFHVKQHVFATNYTHPVVRSVPHRLVNIPRLSIVLYPQDIMDKETSLIFPVQVRQVKHPAVVQCR